MNFADRLWFSKIFSANILHLALMQSTYTAPLTNLYTVPFTNLMLVISLLRLLAARTSAASSLAIITNKTVFEDTVWLLWENWFSSTQAKQFTVNSSTGIAATNEAVKKVINSNMRPGEEDTTCSSRHGAYEHDRHDGCEPWILPRSSQSH